jgi:hypothetical protein
MSLPELTDRMRSEEINTFFATSALTSRAMSGLTARVPNLSPRASCPLTA